MINEGSVRSIIVGNALKILKEYNLDGIGKYRFI